MDLVPAASIDHGYSIIPTTEELAVEEVNKGAEAGNDDPPVYWFEPLEEDDDTHSWEPGQHVNGRDEEEEEEGSVAAESEKGGSVASDDKAFRRTYRISHHRKSTNADEGWVDWPILGEGWKRRQVIRRSGSSVGQRDVYYVGPGGERVRSRVELAAVLGSVMNVAMFDFKTGEFHTGQPQHPRRKGRKSRGRQWSESSCMEKDEGVDTPGPHHLVSPQRRIKNLEDFQEPLDEDDVHFGLEMDVTDQIMESSDTEHSVNIEVDDAEDDMSDGEEGEFDEDDEEWPKRRRRSASGTCSACLSTTDCGQCDFCRDKPKFGGRNTKRQKCRLRQCQTLAKRHLLPLQLDPGRQKPRVSHHRKSTNADEGWVDWPILGEGWKRRQVIRRSGSSVGQRDVYYVGPGGERVRSRVELAAVLGSVMNVAMFDFKTGEFHTGQPQHPRRKRRKSRGRQWSESSCMEKDEGVDTPGPHHLVSPQRRIKKEPGIKEEPSSSGKPNAWPPTLFCAGCGNEFIGTSYDRQRKKPCCPNCWAAKRKTHQSIRTKRWIPCLQCEACLTTSNCGSCHNCEDKLSSLPNTFTRLTCQKRRCLCPVRKELMAGSENVRVKLSPPPSLELSYLEDFQEPLDEDDVHFGFEMDVTDQIMESSDTEHSVNIEVDDAEDDMSDGEEGEFDEDDEEIPYRCPEPASRSTLPPVAIPRAHWVARRGSPEPSSSTKRPPEVSHRPYWLEKGGSPEPASSTKRPPEWYKLDELFEQERNVRTAMTNRAGLLALMLHQTIQHDPLTTDLRSNKDR